MKTRENNHLDTVRRTKRHGPPHRRGAALVLAVGLMFVLFSFLAFTIDTGYLAQSRAEIRRTADAAALAGCWEVYSHLDRGDTIDESRSSVRLAAADMASLNPVCRTAPWVDSSETSQDIRIGYINDLRNPVINNDDSRPYIAVKINVKRTLSVNGEIPFFFGKIFGDTGRPMESAATAAMAQHVSGFSLPANSTDTIKMLPFALDEETWNAMLAGSAPDDYCYDFVTKTVTHGADNVLEVNLYPQGTGSPGNRGTVDIGGSNNTTDDIARQVVNGISSQDLIDLGKPLNLDASQPLDLNGDTGISAGVKDELKSIVGQKRIIPIFSSVESNGNNAQYSIVCWVGVRVLDVKLTGSMTTKKVIVQPATIIAPHATVPTDGSVSSDFVLSPVFLAQ